MNGTGYRILGFLVWQGGKWYVRRKGAQMLPSPRTAGVAAAVTALVVAAAVILSGRRDS